MGLTVLLSMLVIFANLVVDILYGVLDPRTRDIAHLMATTPREAATIEAATGGPATAAGTPIRQASLWRDAWYRYLRNKGAVAAGLFFIALVLYCIVWPIISPYDPDEVNFAIKGQPPSLEHPFGTDNFGRDLFTRTALGGPGVDRHRVCRDDRDLMIGVAYGSISGFVGGQLDNALMRFLDVLYGLVPAVRDHHARHFRRRDLLVDGRRPVDRELVRRGADRAWPSHHAEGERLRTGGESRGGAVVPRPRPPHPAEHARRADHRGVPRLPGVILGEAFLSFIGLGISPPDSSWGQMAEEGRQVYRVYPHIIAIPSIAIASLILYANFIADGLRDALDPRTRET